MKLKFVHLYLFFLVSFFGLVDTAQAQQDPTFTQYMFNNQYFNPAFAGNAEFITAALYYRNQWAGMPNAPVTQNLTGIVPLKRNHMALGLNIVNDNIGITGALNISLSYAYYINLKNGRLSFGVGAGLQQYRLKGDQLSTQEGTSNDLTLVNQSVAKFNPDFSFGVYYKTLRYYIGISTNHISGPSRNVGTNTGKLAEGPANTARHYYLTAGYKFELSDKFTIQPSILTKYSESKLFNNNFSNDFSVKVEYLEMVWLGTTYRTSDALAFFTGINVGKINSEVFKENIRIGYAFDYTVSSIPTYNGGTHEIFISYEYAPKVKRMMPKFK